MGAVASFLALGEAGLTSQDARMVHAAYLAMDLTGWFVIAPLTFASLLTELVQASGTPWGLFRHYWILMKLLVAVLSTALLLVHMQPTGRLASASVETLSSGHLSQMRVQLVAVATPAVLALVVATTLAIYKPRGMTQYGAQRLAPAAAGVHAFPEKRLYAKQYRSSCASRPGSCCAWRPADRKAGLFVA